MNYCFTSALLLSLTLLVACSPNDKSAPSEQSSIPEPSIPKAVADGHALIICVDDSGALLDRVNIRPDSAVQRIEFKAPDSGEEIFVFSLGENVNTAYDMHQMVVSSKKSEGFLGQVHIDIVNGVVAGYSGNSMGMEPQLKTRYATAIKTARATGAEHTNLPMTLIVQADIYRSQLITDTEGNQQPGNLTAQEAVFLNKVKNAMSTGQQESFRSITHTKVGEERNKQVVEDGLKNFQPYEYLHYVFCKIDSEHPDNRDIFYDYSDNAHSYLIEPIYSLDFVIKTQQFDHPMIYGLQVGAVDGELMITLPY